MRHAPTIALAPEEEKILLGWASDPSHGERRARRSRIVLGAARGRTNAEIAAELATSPETVARWRSRFRVTGLDGMEREAPRSGDARRIPPALVARILDATTDAQGAPSGGWSTRSLAKALRVNHMLVHRVWKAHGLLDDRPPVSALGSGYAAAVDVAGAILTPGVRAVVFAVVPDTGGAVGTSVVPDPSSEVSVVALAADPDASSDRLVRRVRRLERIPRNRLVPAASGDPLRVFLRALERKVPSPARLDVVVDRGEDRLDPRTRAWLGAHPRFRLVTPAPGQRWSRAVGAWLARWQRRPGSGAWFRSAASFDQAFLVSSDRRKSGLDRLAWSGRST